MPKGKRKGKSDRLGGRTTDGPLQQLSDDDSLCMDNASVMSNFSEPTTDDGVDETVDDVAVDNLEDQLVDVIDGLSQKSAQGRVAAYRALTAALVKKYIPGFVRDRTFTLCDCVERSLRRGAGTEKAAAASMSAAMCVQLSAGDAARDLWHALQPPLLTNAQDKAAPPDVRAKCCLALGNLAFLSGCEPSEALILMRHLEAIFCGSYLKGDGALPTVGPEGAALHAAALSAWSLTLTMIPPGGIAHMVANTKALPSLEHLSELLESTHLDVRMAAGEALAVIFELGRLENETFFEDFAMDISETLRQLATDSHKYRAKKDRKIQRATFRDILQFIEEDQPTEVKVKFGREVLVLDTWSRRRQYDALCHILGPSINAHLAENELLREIFELGAPLPEEDLEAVPHARSQMERCRKRMLNAANFKARTISRAKNRDKRSDF